MINFDHLTEVQLKYVAVTVISIISFIGCSTPKFYASRRRCPLKMSSILCFGAGVLFETSTLHTYTRAQTSLPDITPIIYCVSFMCLYVVSEIFNSYCDCQSLHEGSCKNKTECIFKKLKFWKSQSQAHLIPTYDQSSFDSETGSSDSSSNDDSSEDTVIKIGKNYPETLPIDLSKSKSYGTTGTVDTKHDIFALPGTSKEIKFFSVPSHDNTKLTYSKSSPSLSSLSQSQGYFKRTSSLHPCFPNPYISVEPNSPSVLSDSVLSERDIILERRLSMQQRRQECCDYNEVSGIEMNSTLHLPSYSIVGHIGLLLALCIHSNLEGISAGADNMEKHIVLIRTGVIASHKLLISTSLGMEIANSGCRWPCVILQSLVFSLTLPGGLLLGHMVHIDDTFHTFIEPIMQAIVGGLIFYVALCEMLPRERYRWHHHKTRKAARIALALSFAAGFITMYCVYTLIDHYGEEYTKNYTQNH